MKLQIVVILAISLIGCNLKKDSNNVKDKDKVEIILSKTPSDEIPTNFDDYKGVKSLTIKKTDQEWSIFPPLSGWNKQIDQAESHHLNNSICSLKELETLNLPDIGITALPECLGNMQQLDSLNLMMNYLIIENEIDKLKALPKLKYLNIVGNRLDTAAIETWQKENPDLKIIYHTE